MLEQTETGGGRVSRSTALQADISSNRTNCLDIPLSFLSNRPSHEIAILRILRQCPHQHVQHRHHHHHYDDGCPRFGHDLP